MRCGDWQFIGKSRWKRAQRCAGAYGQTKNCSAPNASRRVRDFEGLSFSQRCSPIEVTATPRACDVAENFMSPFEQNRSGKCRKHLGRIRGWHDEHGATSCTTASTLMLAYGKEYRFSYRKGERDWSVHGRVVDQDGAVVSISQADGRIIRVNLGNPLMDGDPEPCFLSESEKANISGLGIF